MTAITFLNGHTFLEFEIYPTMIQEDLLQKWILTYSQTLQKFLYKAWKMNIFPKYSNVPLDLPNGSRHQLAQDIWLIYNNVIPDFENPIFRIASKRYALIRTGELSIRPLKIQTDGTKIPKEYRATTLTIFKKDNRWNASIFLKENCKH